MPAPAKKLKPIEQCPDGHYYNSSRTGDICAVCGKKLDPPPIEESEETNELILLDEKEWVCGWLVCIKGINKGRAYAIKEGKNFIGRTSDMDIQIIGDKKIEKKNHAVIMYDSRKGETKLLPSDSHGMVYWKGQAIFEPQTLDTLGNIEFGESIFKYAKFCDADFNWSQGDN
jgi:hypothetical protein